MSISSEGNAYLQVSLKCFWSLGFKFFITFFRDGNWFLFHFPVGKPILEALQGRPTFLFYSCEDFIGSSISSRMFVRTFHAIILCWGISWLPYSSILSTHVNVFYCFYVLRCLFFLFFFKLDIRSSSSSICPLNKLHSVMRKVIWIRQKDLGKSYQLGTRLGHQSPCSRNWYNMLCHIWLCACVSGCWFDCAGVRMCLFVLWCWWEWWWIQHNFTFSLGLQLI